MKFESPWVLNVCMRPYLTKTIGIPHSKNPSHPSLFIFSGGPIGVFQRFWNFAFDLWGVGGDFNHDFEHMYSEFVMEVQMTVSWNLFAVPNLLYPNPLSKMCHCAKMKRASFIMESTEPRETFGFASPTEVLRSVKLYAGSDYGSMLWKFDGESAGQSFTSWRTCVKLAWHVPRQTHT